MATCERYEEALWEAAESDDISTELRRHLDVCPACREELAALQQAMTGFAVLRQIPDHVPVPAPLPSTARWWPRAAFVGVVVALAIVGIAIGLLAWKQQAPIVKQPPSPVIYPEQQEQPKEQGPAQVIVVEPKQPVVVPQIVRSAVAPKHRHARIRQHDAPSPIAVRHEPLSPEPELLPVPEYDPVEMLISAQPVNGLVPLDAVPIDTQALTAVSDLPLTYALTPVSPEEMQRLLQLETSPEDERLSRAETIENALVFSADPAS